MNNLLRFSMLAIILGLAGCGYSYYLGLPGPSIWNYPDIHDADLKEDNQCLECHGSVDNDVGAPVTSHPGFHGCLKCHDSPVQS
jgi:hypothetical protein